MTPIRLDGLVTLGDRSRWALLSPDGLYRYALGATWDEEPGEYGAVRPVFCATLKNPSKATHEVDDPTWLKLVHFAKQEGCGGLLLRNLGAWRATDPRELQNVSDPVGPRNSEVLALDPLFAIRVAGWGAFETKRIARALGYSVPQAKMSCNFVLGLTRDGHPRHPLYLPNSTRAILWSDARTAARAIPGEGASPRKGETP
jgi:hypothetical protein